ncbi:MAG: hypothetical protein J7L14_02335 [Candidatus Diapherotrites archaeon]|nr:hypothetical protein [Candidatus Diapherotrites archaeon]
MRKFFLIGFILLLSFFSYAQLQCSIKPQCANNEADVFQFSSGEGGGHVSLTGVYNNHVCCILNNEKPVVATGGCAGNPGTIFAASDLCNAHIASVDIADQYSNFDNIFSHRICFNTNPRVYCAFKQNCDESNNEVCLARASDLINAHVSDCGSSFPYAICCSTNPISACNLNCVSDNVCNPECETDPNCPPDPDCVTPPEPQPGPQPSQNDVFNINASVQPSELYRGQELTLSIRIENVSSQDQVANLTISLERLTTTFVNPFSSDEFVSGDYSSSINVAANSSELIELKLQVSDTAPVPSNWRFNINVQAAPNESYLTNNSASVLFTILAGTQPGGAPISAVPEMPLWFVFIIGIVVIASLLYRKREQ